jgi:hypothetical protein
MKEVRVNKRPIRIRGVNICLWLIPEDCIDNISLSDAILETAIRHPARDANGNVNESMVGIKYISRSSTSIAGIFFDKIYSARSNT